MALDMVESGQLDVIPGVTKRCSKCGEVKEVGEFYKEKRNLNGIKSECKRCSFIRYKEYTKKNKVKRKDTYKKHYEKNKNIIHAKNKIRRIANSSKNASIFIIESFEQELNMIKSNIEIKKELLKSGRSICIKCEKVKPFSCFDKDSSKNYGISNMCKICTSIYNKEYRTKNKIYNHEYYYRKKAERLALANMNAEVSK